MHVEALNWSGLCATHYANARNLSLVSLRRWRDLFDSGEVEIDWRAYLHLQAFFLGERLKNDVRIKICGNWLAHQSDATSKHDGQNYNVASDRVPVHFRMLIDFAIAFRNEID
jgi:hypothetical protein